LPKFYLQNKGYYIIEKNYRTKYAEIDLIARNKSVLVFVEVRARKDERFGSPEDSIKRSKNTKTYQECPSLCCQKRIRKNIPNRCKFALSLRKTGGQTASPTTKTLLFEYILKQSLEKEDEKE